MHVEFKCLQPSHPLQPFVTSLEPQVGPGMWVLKSFPLQRPHFILHGAAQDFAYKRLPVFCSASECVRPCSEFVFPGIWREGRRGMGLTCSSFFLQTTQNAGVLTSGLVCSLASNMCSTVPICCY